MKPNKEGAKLSVQTHTNPYINTYKYLLKEIWKNIKKNQKLKIILQYIKVKLNILVVVVNQIKKYIVRDG